MTARMTIIPNAMDQEEDYKPRYMVLAKMEKLIRDMQNSETGIPVRCQKNFLTTIPQAFTGYDFVEWVNDKLNLEDGSEALHLAGLLCQYGYIFPVTDSKNLAVKDDGTLYRFQSPYFWPSQNWEPDNVDYAIYLAKRSMRNKQRHGLEEHEQAAFNKLQKMLCDKWDFIYMQAEEQVRLAKDRKKADKVVLDSQEKAYWRVHRPPPGQVKCLEEGVRRNYKPSQIAQRKKKTIEGYQKEIAFLQRRLLQPRMKMSKAVESLLNHCEQYLEHDPVLSSPQPSNPWITEDNTMWILNTLLVETPTERRMKRWGFGLGELLADPTGRHEFEIFLEKEYSSENIHFWQAVEELKKLPLSRVEQKVQEIYRDYLSSGAPFEINIDSKTMDCTLQNLKKPSRYTFAGAQDHIFLLMKKDSYARFLRSDQYKNLLTNAINPCPKKKFFTFGGRKKSPVPSPIPSPKSKRRGSSGSPFQNDKLVANSLSQHSYSTGNLQELDMDIHSNRSTPYGSAGDIKAHDSSESKWKKRLSPKSIKKKLEEILHGPDTTPRNSLDVPNNAPVVPIKRVPAVSSSPELYSDHRDNEISMTIAVPNTNNSKRNVVAPWEDGDE